MADKRVCSQLPIFNLLVLLLTLSVARITFDLNIERWHISETYDYYNQSHNQNYNHTLIYMCFYNYLFFCRLFITFFSC